MNWAELEKACQNCTRCELSGSRTNLVFGQGNTEADLMFIGEAPGEQEDLSGIPFVGPSGQLFDRILNAAGISREEVYIANILKCRPPRNRDPQDHEKQACLPHLRNQVRLVKPKIIVCLGRVAAQSIIDPNFRITRRHGEFIERKGYWLTAMFHPSALLRNPAYKRGTWEDIQKIKAKYDEVRGTL